MDVIEEGIRRTTFPLPFGLDHVHCYFLRTEQGWTLVDTGLGVAEPAERWQPVLAELDAPLERIVVTHMHPDHVGGAADVASISGAPVLQGRADYEQCVNAWGDRDAQRFVDYWVSHGIPAADVAGIARESERLVRAVHWVRDPHLLDAGDAIVGGITPTIGLYPNSRPDPLGDYLETLERIEAIAPRIAYAGHNEPILDPAGRAREIIEHHRERLDGTVAALDGVPLSAYDVSLALFERDLSPAHRRFATAESLAHLERLVREGRAQRIDRRYIRA